MKGSVLVPVKSGSMASSQTLKLTTAGRGIQEPSEYESAAEKVSPPTWKRPPPRPASNARR